jgi:hypothetical protein
MIMATISENLQTIKSSTDAIKQAIIDKGGAIEGDITTWADAISGLSGGSSEGNTGRKSVDFYCTFSYSGTTLNISGYFSNSDFLSQYDGYCRLIMGFYNNVSTVSGFTMVRSDNYNNISFSIDNAVDAQTEGGFPLIKLFNMYAVITPMTLYSDQGSLQVNLCQSSGGSNS